LGGGGGGGGGGLTGAMGVYLAADKEVAFGGGLHFCRGEGHRGHLHGNLPVGHHLTITHVEFDIEVPGEILHARSHLNILHCIVCSVLNPYERVCHS